MDVSQYLEIFIDETAEHIQSLSDNIMALENEPEDHDVINEIFRAAHSLKGMAGTMGFKRMQHLTHDMENVFQEVRNDKIKVNGDIIDVLFQCLDAIEGYLNIIKETSDEGTNDNEGIIAALNGILNGDAAPAVKDTKEAADQKPAQAEEAAAGGHMKKFLQLELSEAERESLKNAEDSGKVLFGFTVYVQKECLLKAARAFLVFKAVEEFGEILVYHPGAQDIEDEKFDLDFSFLMSADEEGVDKFLTVAKAVSEIEDVFGEQIKYEMLVATSDKEKEPEGEKAASAEPAAPAVAPAAAVQAKGDAAKTAGTAAKGKPVNKPVANRTVRVDIEKLDALMNQVSELIIAKNSLVSISSSDSGDGTQSQSFRDQIEYLERITTSLHESVMKARMVPIESVVAKFPRMIRDLSRKLDKKMELYMSGEDTELDRTVVDQIGDPLQHLLRNSADHGLESAELRKERGKPEVGSINLKAYQEGNNVVIEVGDDGNGIDTENVKRKAIDRGLVTPEQAENLSQKEIIDFLFMPSFSMAKKITDVSGRGVGLDVVKSNIETLGGDVEVKSKLGEGSTFIVRLPLTLAIIQALLVEVHHELFAIALGSIITIEDVPVSEIKYVQAEEVINLRGNVIPLIRLNQILDIEEPENAPESLTVVIVNKGEKQAGLVVDNLLGQQEIVIKSLGKFISNSKIISGATILGDGEIALILDVNTLM
ncbi:MAG: chemotaxis protein CheA [Eubacterium sp.]|nr:chemotaxis protein CheA [Eubacterium sp.]